jgi:diguanylate cyclase (GGDEF)-like protein/PAS domain S-box-containing protein
MKVLFLEDSAEDFELVREHLRAEGFECDMERVAGADSYLRALHAGGLDLILSDHALPGFDGISALRLAKQHRPEVPFIFVSGAILEEQAIDTLKDGATDYVLKHHLARLGPAVRRALQEASEQAERRRAEAALRESERQLRQIIDLVPHFIFAKDEEGRFLIANQAVADAYGTTVANLLGQRDTDFASSKQEVEHSHADDVEVIRTGRPKLIPEEAISDAQGRVRQLQTIKIPFTPMGLNQQAVLGVSTDITELRRAEEDRKRAARQLEDIMEAIPDVLYLLDLEGGLVRWNRQAELVTGYSAAELRGMSALQFVGEADGGRVIGSIQAAYAMGFAEVEASLRRKDGSLVPYHFAGAPLRDEMGQAIGLAGVGRDIRERKRADQELRLAATAFESHEGIFITDSQGTILRVNRAFTEITGYPAQEAVGNLASMLSADLHDDAFPPAVWAALKHAGSWQGEIYFRRKNGELYPTWESMTEVKSEEGQVTHFVCHFQDISERKQVQARIEHLAYHDPLTRLPNRSLLLDRLQQALARNRRRGLRGALLFMDLDRFKNINDSLGHPTGDLLLCEVGSCLTSQVRSEDTVARLGGDEFVVLLAELDGNREMAASEARAVADKIHAAVSRNFDVAGYTLRVGASIGVAVFPDGDETADDVLRHADIAMYRAKAAGRGTMCFFSPDMQAAATERLELEGQLRQALEKSEFVLHFQPQVEITTGRIRGAESLMRWTHPQRGALSPALFVPVLEESGLILPAGDWVLRAACRTASLLARSHADLKIAVNVSPRQLHQSSFADRVRSILNECSTRPETIELEITEGAVIQDVDDTVKVMSVLKDLGVRFSLDDFGTGYSSLSYVKRLPLDTLKIDRAFVRDCTTDPNDAAIVRAIIAMARSLDLGVVAEGVEQEAQLRFLQELGCAAYQGFLFSPPVPEAQLLAMLSNGVIRQKLAG